MAKSGVSKKTARTAHTNVKRDLQSLEAHMNQLVNHVQQMNASIWYGSETANKWYTTMRGHYCANAKGNLVTFYNGVTAFQNSLESQFKKASTKGISF